MRRIRRGRRMRSMGLCPRGPAHPPCRRVPGRALGRHPSRLRRWRAAHPPHPGLALTTGRSPRSRGEAAVGDEEGVRRLCRRMGRSPRVPALFVGRHRPLLLDTSWGLLDPLGSSRGLRFRGHLGAGRPECRASRRPCSSLHPEATGGQGCRRQECPRLRVVVVVLARRLCEGLVLRQRVPSEARAACQEALVPMVRFAWPGAARAPHQGPRLT